MRTDTTRPSVPALSPSTVAIAGAVPPAPRKRLARLARLGRWLLGPADPPGAPFAAARRRLIFTTVAIVAIVLGALSVAIFLFNQHAGREQTVTMLKYYATAGSTGAQDDDGEPPGNQNATSNPLVPYSASSSNTFIVVLDMQGNTIADSYHIQQLGVPVVGAAQPVLRGQQQEITPTVTVGGHTYQLYIARVQRDDHIVNVVVAGASLDQQERQEDALWRTLAIINGVALLLIFFATLLLTEHALRPARLAFIRQRQFATAASHELRTPLAVIRSEAELASGLLGDSLAALRGSSGNRETTEDVSGYMEEALHETQAATTEVDYMARMVQGMLMLARDATDSLAHPWSDVDLRTLLEDITDRLRPIAEHEGLSISAPAMPSLVDDPQGTQVTLVRGDADLLRQLFFGLLENAMRYTPDGGRIWVDLRVERRGRLLGDHHRHAYVSISDTGMGIAPEHLPHIFEPFYRVVSAARPLRGAQHGSGLGLALAQWIVQAHGGVIEARSTVGAGTTFTVALPLASG